MLSITVKAASSALSVMSVGLLAQSDRKGATLVEELKHFWEKWELTTRSVNNFRDVTKQVSVTSA